MRPNIIFYFSDQQRADTCGCYGQPLPVTPNLDVLAGQGVVFEHAYSAQPVCGPCRALFQTGRYPTELGCFRNDKALPPNVKTLADYFNEAGYETAYVGKWHLASDDGLADPPNVNYTVTAIPPERRGGYKDFWRASDILEFTSHGYDGYVFDDQGRRCDFKGYRADCITDFALEYLDKVSGEKPFFMTISHIEPHHQNDRSCYEGPEGSKERFGDYVLPGDLEALGGNAREMYPDYLGCCRSLDDNLGRVIDKLREKGILENTVIVYASDHGSHFLTRNQDAHRNGYDDYKRSCHSSALHVPLVICGPGFTGGKRVKELVSTASLPKTFLAMASVDVGGAMIGEDLKTVVDGKTAGRENIIFAQISESRVGRCVRTEDWLYSVYAPGKDGNIWPDSDLYADDFLYDLRKDPLELNNLIDDPAYASVRDSMAALLKKQMEKAGEAVPVILRSGEYQ